MTLFHTNANWTADYTLYKGVVMDCSSGSRTVTLPAINGKDLVEFIAKRGDGNALATLTLTPASGETIDGSASKAVALRGCVVLRASQGNWYIIASHTV
jgi:hypothetical protein